MSDLQIVQDRKFTRKRVRIDGRSFVRCTFTDCIIEYSGGDIRFEETMFIRPELQMDGPAANTTEVLRTLGALNESMFQFPET